MKRLRFLLRPSMAFVTVLTLSLFNNHAYAVRLLNESFENFDSNNDPIGWQATGHPNYLRVANEADDNWTTPYSEHAMSTYSNGVGTKMVGKIPSGNTADGDYTVKFNISSSAAIGEYRAELWVNDYLAGWTLLGWTEGDTDGSKDFSFTDEITWRYEYQDWVHPDFGFSTISGADLQIKLMQDPNRTKWQHTPVWDNVIVDYVPDLDTQAPTLVNIADDNEGITVISTNQTVTYTVTFSEAINPATVDASDFGNAAAATTTIQSVNPTDDEAVFLVEAFATTEGNMRLSILQGAVIEDVSANSMNTANSLQDNVTFTVDASIPTILPSDFVDDQNGGPIAEDTLVTYTLTFSKDMNAGSVSAADFGNAGTAPITFGTITETTPGVFTVQVTPTGSGTLRLRINQNSLITAADGGQLSTSSAIVDDTTIIVDSVLPTLTDIKDYAASSPVAAGALLTYEVFFSEAMDLSSIDASDFGNALTSGAAPFTIDLIDEASPGVIRIEITPTGAGSIQLQVNPGAVLTDTTGNELNTTTAIIDDVIVTVAAAGTDPYDTWSGGSAAFGDDANGDGITNGMAWFLGANNPTEDALSLLPTASVNASGDLILSFRALKTANRGGYVAKVQFSNDMGATDLWTNNEAEIPDTNSTVNGVVFDTTDAGDYIDVTATIPASKASASGGLFGRLLVE